MHASIDKDRDRGKGLQLEFEALLDLRDRRVKLCDDRLEHAGALHEALVPWHVTRQDREQADEDKSACALAQIEVEH